METPQAPLFDASALSLRTERATARQSDTVPFLAERVLDDLAERLLDVNRSFGNAQMVGPFDWRDALNNRLPKGRKLPGLDFATEPAGKARDLVISLLTLQSINDIPGWMRSIRQTLAPDGLFIAAFIGGASLSTVRQAFYEIDTNRFGAPLPRFHPMIEVKAAAPLLSHVGLALPVLDSDRFTVRYRRVETLFSDLRDVGLTNALVQRDRRYIGRDIFERLNDRLRPSADEPIPIEWEIIWMTGWAPHESQQKPLAPGSAKVGLNEALRSIRDSQL